MPIDFVANMLADAVGFLSTNVVQTATVKVDPGVTTDFQVRIPTIPPPVRFRAGSVFLGLGNKKKDGTFFEARNWDQFCNETETSEKVSVVWSGYAAGLATHCDLPAVGGPDLMFTPRLDGCTLTWQSNTDGSAKFGHYNLKTGEDTSSAADMLIAAQANYVGDFGIMTKETYFDKAKRITAETGDKRTMANAFGIRSGGWKFIIQYIETKPGGVLQIRDVEELAPARWYNLERY